MNVELHDFFRSASAAVGDPRGKFDLAAHRNARSALGEGGIVELPVGQAVAKRVERAVWNAAEVGFVRLQWPGRIGPTGALVGVIIRLLTRGAREADRQSSRRARRSEQDVGDGVARLGTQEPCSKDR